MLMYKKDGGYHNFGEHEVADALNNGWVDGATIRAAAIAAKVAPVSESVILPVRDKHRGRPRKVEDVTTLGRYDGDSTDNH